MLFRSTDIDRTVADFDRKGRHRFGRRHARRFAIANIEACTVPGAGNFTSNYRPVSQRLTIVRTNIFDAVKVIAHP
jgi:hypothetical protein